MICPFKMDAIHLQCHPPNRRKTVSHQTKRTSHLCCHHIHKSHFSDRQIEIYVNYKDFSQSVSQSVRQSVVDAYTIQIHIHYIYATGLKWDWVFHIRYYKNVLVRIGEMLTYDVFLIYFIFSQFLRTLNHPNWKMFKRASINTKMPIRLNSVA